MLKGQDFFKILNTYLSNDRKVMTLDVVFNKNPYSNEVIKRVPELKQAVNRAVKDTKLENAQVEIGGVTSIYHDLNTISEHDYSRTVVLMLIGIGIIFNDPASLFDYAALFNWFISINILYIYGDFRNNFCRHFGIHWYQLGSSVFCILIALGIDYSIFLMDRFNEYRHLPVEQAILGLCMKKMGTVIISAAIILAGTFAAMMPSGVLSLLEIATIILIGLILYTLFILPLFVPVMVKTFGAADSWPFMKPKATVNQNSEITFHS